MSAHNIVDAQDMAGTSFDEIDLMMVGVLTAGDISCLVPDTYIMSCRRFKKLIHPR